jgi:hypothetical protein
VIVDPNVSSSRSAGGQQQQWLTYRFLPEKGGEKVKQRPELFDDEIVDRGGLEVAHDLLLDDRSALAEEILTHEAGMFRTDPIQGGREPRIHFLLYNAATQNDDNDDNGDKSIR